jgi:hypothetical protein
MGANFATPRNKQINRRRETRFPVVATASEAIHRVLRLRELDCFPPRFARARNDGGGSPAALDSVIESRRVSTDIDRTLRACHEHPRRDAKARSPNWASRPDVDGRNKSGREWVCDVALSGGRKSIRCEIVSVAEGNRVAAGIETDCRAAGRVRRLEKPQISLSEKQKSC